MQGGHARESRTREPEGEAQRADEPRAPAPVSALLGLQRTAGNQAVQQILARTRDTTFTYGPGHSGVELARLRDADALADAVEETLEDRYDGVQALFLTNSVATSRAQWSGLLYDDLQESYELEGLDANDVLTAIGTIKDKHRDRSLRHIAAQHVYSASEVVPYSADNLRQILTQAGAHLEPDDDDVIDALFQTQGLFTRLEFEVPDDHVELSDEASIVVLLDSHQNKHQRDKIGQLPPYPGEPGAKFAFGKGLTFHEDETEPVVRECVREAIAANSVTAERNFYLPKKAIGPIIYDLTVTYDEFSGRYVGSYHCNPVKDEG